jgi:hypothetical protein
MKRPNPSHEVAAADKTHLARLGRIQGGPARVLKKETLEGQVSHLNSVFGSCRCSRQFFRCASSNPRRRYPQLQELQRREELFINGLRLHTSTAFLAVADSPDDSSAVLAAIHVVAIHELQRREELLINDTALTLTRG